MHFIKSILLLSILSFTLFSCSTQNEESQQESQQQEIISGWKLLNEDNYSIQYPSNWKLQKPGPMGAVFFIFSELDSETDNFTENVNLMVQDLQGQDMTLSQAAAASEKQIMATVNSPNIITSEELEANGKSFYKLMYSGVQGKFDLQFEQYYWIEKGTIYALTFTSKKDEFDKFKETGEQILNSFQLK